MMPPPPILHPGLTVPECHAVMRAIGYAVKVDAAEADRDRLVSALGAISEAVARWDDLDKKRAPT